MCESVMYERVKAEQWLCRQQREELTRVILMLLVAWRDPLWHFQQSMSHQHDFNNFSSNKALQMSDMVHELRKGVEKVAEKVTVLLLWQMFERRPPIALLEYRQNE